jgi:hypothetical protein
MTKQQKMAKLNAMKQIFRIGDNDGGPVEPPPPYGPVIMAGNNMMPSRPQRSSANASHRGKRALQMESSTISLEEVIANHGVFSSYLLHMCGL